MTGHHLRELGRLVDEVAVDCVGDGGLVDGLDDVGLPCGGGRAVMDGAEHRCQWSVPHGTGGDGSGGGDGVG